MSGVRAPRGEMPRSSRVTSARTLTAAFAAVASTFTLAIALTQITNLRVREIAHVITADTSPTIATLSTMRSTTRGLERAAADFVDDCEERACTAVPEKIETLRRKLWTDWERYQQLPWHPGERDAWPRVEARLRSLDGELTAVLGHVLRSDAGAAHAMFRRKVESSFDALDDAISAIVESDHAHSVALASKIDVLARRSLVLAVVLVAVSLGLTVLTAALAIALVRRHERLLTQHAAELDLYAGRVAHEVSGPLWAASAALEVTGHATDWRRSDALERAVRSVELAKQLAKGLLDFARSGATCNPDTWEDVPTAMEAVSDNLRLVAEQNGVELRFEPACEGRVACGSGILESIVANLAGNAIKHMGDGEIRRVVVRTREEGARDRIRVEVEDTGPGIPPTVGERIFEPFFRGSDAKSPGFGLGLATVRRLVTAHGGDVGFTPRAGGGTVFWVEMPRAGARSEAGSPTSPRPRRRPVDAE
jgi:signal transduction histidine kinase